MVVATPRAKLWLRSAAVVEGALPPPGRKRLDLGSRGGRGDGAAARIEASEAARAEPDGVAAIEVTTNDDAQAGAAAAARLLGELQDDAIEGDGVVASDDPVLP